MCLTEPQCGTDLGLLRTKAVPQPRRQLPAHGHEDLHLRRRARPGREHRPPRAGAAAGCAGGHARASACSSCRNSCPAPTARPGARNGVVCGAHRAQDGHQGLGHLPARISTAPTGWLVGRAAQGHGGDVRDDERGAPGVGIQGLGLAEVAYQNAVAYAKDRLQGALARRPEVPRQARRPDHRPPRRAPDAADHARLRRRRPRAGRAGWRCSSTRTRDHPDAAERKAATTSSRC